MINKRTPLNLNLTASQVECIDELVTYFRLKNRMEVVIGLLGTLPKSSEIIKHNLLQRLTRVYTAMSTMKNNTVWESLESDINSKEDQEVADIALDIMWRATCMKSKI